MKIDLKRDARQYLSVTKWRNNSGIGCVHACPRYGKTFVGLKAIQLVRDAHPNAPIVIIVPSDIIRSHWKKYVTDIPVYTITKATNDISKIIANPTFVLIVDEIHRYTTDDMLDTIGTLCRHSQFRLGLTGTYPKDNRRLKELFPVIDRISEEEAIENGWISDYLEYNLPVELTDSEKERYTKFSSFITQTLELFKGKAAMFNGKSNFIDDDYDLIMSCFVGKLTTMNGKRYHIEGSKIRDAVAHIMGWNKDLDLSNPVNKERDLYWNPNALFERCKQFKDYVSKRNELLINNENKLKMVLEIINRNPVPTIIFNESIDFVNTIADALGKEAIAYHSKIKSRPMLDDNGEYVRFSTGKIKMFGATRLKEAALQGIKEGKYKYLVTAKSLDEGLDLPELRQVIITAGASNPIQQIQRSARAKTTDANDVGKFSIIFNVYIDDFRNEFGDVIKSRDKGKLFTRQSTYTHSVIWLNNLDEFTL